MNFKKSTLVIIAFSLLISLIGCAKKPRRPNPLDTVTGSGQGQFEGGPGFGQFDGSDNFGNPEDFISERDETLGSETLITSIYFDTDSASIKPSERNKLTQAADFVRNNPGSRLLLEGHCDWRLTQEYNLALGERRSRSVKRYLETLGINAGQLEATSKGDLEAIEGASAAQMAKDRRVEVSVIR